MDEFSPIGVGKIKESRQHPRRQFNTHRIDPIKRFTHRQVVENIFHALSDQRLKIRQVARGDRWRNSRSLLIMAGGSMAIKFSMTTSVSFSSSSGGVSAMEMPSAEEKTSCCVSTALMCSWELTDQYGPLALVHGNALEHRAGVVETRLPAIFPIKLSVADINLTEWPLINGRRICAHIHCFTPSP